MAWVERIAHVGAATGAGAGRPGRPRRPGPALRGRSTSSRLAAPPCRLPPPARGRRRGCEVSLQQASELFDSGQVPGGAGPPIDQCLKGKPSRAEKSRALAPRRQDPPRPRRRRGRRGDRRPPPRERPRVPARRLRPAAIRPPRGDGEGPRSPRRRSRRSPSRRSALAEAPATVVVITGEEIARRGYTDLEAVLRDLPGFDFSRRAGASYSNIYQRGYRSIETTRTMLLVDGVEDNDLASSTAWISRQFPLSNVERIEVVYGPASTMYGANAFAGVINVITKDPEQLVKDGKLWGTDARVGASTDAGMLDATVAGQTRNGGLRWSLTARKWKGQDFEHLEDDPNWDYDPAFYDGVDYTKLSSLNATTPAAASAILAKYTPEQLAPYFKVTYDAQGKPASVTLTPEGAARARGFDKTLLRKRRRRVRQPGRRLDGLRQADDLELPLRLPDLPPDGAGGDPPRRHLRRDGRQRLPLDAGAHVDLREVLAALPRREALGEPLRPVQAARARRDRLGRRLPRELPAREPEDRGPPPREVALPLGDLQVPLATTSSGPSWTSSGSRPTS